MNGIEDALSSYNILVDACDRVIISFHSTLGSG